MFCISRKKEKRDRSSKGWLAAESRVYSFGGVVELWLSCYVLFLCPILANHRSGKLLLASNVKI